MAGKAGLVIIRGGAEQRFAKGRVGLVKANRARLIRAQLRGAEMIGMQIGELTILYSRQCLSHAVEVICLFPVRDLMDMDQTAGKIIDIVNGLPIHNRFHPLHIPVIEIARVNLRTRCGGFLLKPLKRMKTS